MKEEKRHSEIFFSRMLAVSDYNTLNNRDFSKTEGTGKSAKTVLDHKAVSKAKDSIQDIREKLTGVKGKSRGAQSIETIGMLTGHKFKVIKELSLEEFLSQRKSFKYKKNTSNI